MLQEVSKLEGTAEQQIQDMDLGQEGLAQRQQPPGKCLRLQLTLQGYKWPLNIIRCPPQRNFLEKLLRSPQNLTTCTLCYQLSLGTSLLSHSVPGIMPGAESATLAQCTPT